MATAGSSTLLSCPLLKSTYPNLVRYRCLSLHRTMAASTDQKSSPEKISIQNGSLSDLREKKRKEINELISYAYSNPDEIPDEKGKPLENYLEECKDLMIESKAGPPRWFTPLECGSHTSDSPLLLFLPGIDGMGLGLIKHHSKLGKIFDMWCLHIPVTDKTSFTDLVKLVERTVRSECQRSPNRPIYIVGESVGACIALDVASRNPDVDLVLILANPGANLCCYNPVGNKKGFVLGPEHNRFYL